MNHVIGEIIFFAIRYLFKHWLPRAGNQRRTHAIFTESGNKDLRTLCLQQRINHDRNANREEFYNPFNEFIDNRCKQLSQTKTGRDGAYHLAEWMKDHVGNVKAIEEDYINDVEQRSKAEENRCRKTVRSFFSSSPSKGGNRPDEANWSTQKTANKQGEVKHQVQCAISDPPPDKASFNNTEKTVSVCRECHKTCLKHEGRKVKEELPEDDEDEEEDDCGESWGPLMMLGMCGILPAIKNSSDPFAPIESPTISVLPPTPDKKPKNIEPELSTKTTKSENSSSFNDSRTNNSGCYKVTCKMSTTPHSMSTIKKPQIQITKLVDGDDDDMTPEDEPPYKTLSSSTGLRRFGTLNSLERVSSEDLDKNEQHETAGGSNELETKKKIGGKCKGENEKKEKEENLDEDEDKIEVKTHPLEMGDSIRGWTVRAGSFVAAKMAFFERLSGPDNSVSVRKTTFLERYFKPVGENNLETSEVGTNTSSSGRGEEEGETSGATSGEEVWGTPTSGGDYDDDLHGESSTLSIFESPRGSIETDDDTEQLMEDLLISLPMLAMRTRGFSPRRRLEPLLEEEDSEGSSTSCSPKPVQVQGQDNKAGQGRGSRGSPKQQHDGSPKSEVLPRRSIRNAAKNRARIGTIDRALGIHPDDEEPSETTLSTSPSFLRKLGLKRNPGRRDSGRKCSRILGFLSGKKKVNSSTANPNSAIYGAKPLFRYLFNKDPDDDIPTTLPRGYAPPFRRNEKRLEKRFWNQLKRRKNTATEVPVVESNRK